MKRHRGASARPEVQKPRKYRYRSLPCNIQPRDKIWCVTGYDRVLNGGGVLEWCYDRDDALRIKMAMQHSGEFLDLLIEGPAA